MEVVPRSPKFLFIDLDGTLAESLNVLKSAYEKFAIEFNFESSQKEFDSLNGPPLREVISHLNSKHSLAQPQALLEKKYHRIIQALYDDVEISPGGVELLDFAEKHDCKIGIVTSNYRNILTNWLVTRGISQRIAFSVCSEDIEFGKPSPQPYLRALSISNVTSSQVIVLEDSSSGVQSALSAGLEVFQLSQGGKAFIHPRVSVVPSLTAAAREIFGI
jgi:HAD superfamily hydrolase (TIGR01509 family)